MQIANQFRTDILAGKYAQGEYLPSIRRLAKDLKISVITTMKAYEELADQGVKLLMTGMLAFVILLFTGICYKFFVVSMIVMYIFMFGAGMLLEIGLHFFIPKGFIHPLVAIVADIVLVLTGGVIQYGLMKLFYKFPLSKAAFGAAAKRGMNA